MGLLNRAHRNCLVVLIKGEVDMIFPGRIAYQGPYPKPGSDPHHAQIRTSPAR